MTKSFLIIIFILILVLSRLEKIGVVLRSLNTLIHELGHGIIALILGGKLGKITLNSNSSGSCSTTSKGSFKTFLVSISGYTSSALFSYFLFFSINKPWNHYIFSFLLIISIISIIFWIRNTYGIIWTIAFIAINFSLIMIPNLINNIGNQFLLIYGLIIGLDNLFSTFLLLKISIYEPKNSGDAKNLSKITNIPSFIWAIGFLCFSLWIAYLSFMEFYPVFK